MKTYTEEQVKDMLNTFIGERNVDDYLQRYYTPIEIPSDEEIEKEAPYSTLGWGYEFGMNDGFKKGAKFVINKIQGGNK
jgi:hypothetical protein